VQPLHVILRSSQAAAVVQLCVCSRSWGTQSRTAVKRRACNKQHPVGCSHAARAAARLQACTAELGSSHTTQQQHRGQQACTAPPPACSPPESLHRGYSPPPRLPPPSGNAPWGDVAHALLHPSCSGFKRNGGQQGHGQGQGQGQGQLRRSSWQHASGSTQASPARCAFHAASLCDAIFLSPCTAKVRAIPSLTSPMLSIYFILE
jgi:hypothetical protein